VPKWWTLQATDAKIQALQKGKATRGMDVVVQSLKQERMTAPDIPSIMKLSSA
jgi:hypothetical protein